MRRIWTRLGANAVAAMLVGAGLAACGDDASAPSSRATSEPGGTGRDDVADVTVFDYPAKDEVAVRVLDREATRGARVREVSYPSPLDGSTVTATLTTPTNRPTAAGVLLLHGMPSDREDMRVPGVVFACAGATALAIDAPFVRNGEGTIKLDSRDRQEQIQLITDLRRGIDVLEQSGAEALSVVGISYGASMSALLVGVDDRVGSAALIVGDGGLVAHLTGESGEPVSPLTAATAEQQKEWLSQMRPIEPVKYVGLSEADLLFLNGRSDTFVAVSDAEALHAAAPEGSEIRWYDTGHDLPAEAFRYQFEWVGRHLGLDSGRLEGCVDDHGGLGP